MKPKIIAHGGAWNWDDSLDAPKAAGIEQAVSIGYEILRKGGTALDAVEQTVVSLEDNPLYDAGTGGYLNRDGIVQLDALIVDGSKHDFGAVGGVTRVKNPITLARKVMEQSDFCFFVGEGADRQAEILEVPQIDNATLVTPAMLEFFHAARTDGPSDTVGAVAIDQDGNVAVATSTSGTPFKPAGRVGDSPLYGAGGYAENGIGTVGATGFGENIMRTLLAKYTADRLQAGQSVSEASAAAMDYADQLFEKSMVGVILIDSQGNVGAAHTTPKIGLAWTDDDGQIQSAMNAKPLR